MRTLDERELDIVSGGVTRNPSGGTCTRPEPPPNGGLPGKWPQLPGTQDQIR